MKKLLIAGIVLLVGFISYQQYSFYKNALPIYQLIKTHEFTENDFDHARQISIERVEIPLGKGEENVWQVLYPTAKGMNQKQKFNIEGNEVVVAGHDPIYTRIDDMIQSTIEIASSEGIKENFEQILGVEAIDTYSNILEYSERQPSFWISPDERFFDLSIITTKLSLLNSESITYMTSPSWKAVVSENTYSDNGGYSCDYYNVDSGTGLTLYFVNRSENKKFTKNQVREFLNNIEITDANQAQVATP